MVPIFNRFARKLDQLSRCLVLRLFFCKFEKLKENVAQLNQPTAIDVRDQPFSGPSWGLSPTDFSSSRISYEKDHFDCNTLVQITGFPILLDNVWFDWNVAGVFCCGAWFFGHLNFPRMHLLAHVLGRSRRVFELRS
jgi:hypothetical protein